MALIWKVDLLDYILAIRSSKSARRLDYIPNLRTKVCNRLFKLCLILLLGFNLLQLLLVFVVLCFYMQEILDLLDFH